MGAIAVEKAATAWDKCKAYLDTINHMIIFAVTIYITYLSWYMGPNNSTWHVWLCTIGVSQFWNFFDFRGMHVFTANVFID